MAQNRKQLALQTVKEAFELARDARKPFERKWNEYYRLSEGIVPSQKAKWMTNRFIPYTPAIIDLILPRLAARRPSATVTGWDMDSGIKQEKFNDLLVYQQDQMHIDAVFSDWIYDSIRYGTGFLKMGWKKETAKNLPHSAVFIARMKAYFSSLGFNLNNDDMLYDGPTVDHVDIFDFFPHPKATSLDNAIYVIHRTEQTRHQIEQNPKYGKVNWDEIPKGDAQIDEFRRQRLVSEGLPASQAQKLVGQMSVDYYEVLEYYGLFDIDGDGLQEECEMTAINRSQLAQMDECPYYHGQKPFIHLRYQSKPKWFYGRGVVERVRDLQYELNDIANQSSDMRKLTLFPVIKIRKGAGLDLENIKIAPGLPIPLDNPEDMIFERIPDFTDALEFMSKSTREAMQIATGATDVVTGQEDIGIASDTLGGAQIAQEQSSLRFLMPSMNLDSAIEKFGDMLMSLNQQYFDRKKTIRIFEDEGVTYKEIGPKDITGQYSYRVTTQSMAPQSKAMMQQKYVNLKQLFMNDPNIDMDKIDNMILQAFDVDPETVRKAQAGSTPALQAFKGMQPAQQQAYIKTLQPNDQELLQKAIGGSLPQENPGTPLINANAHGGQFQ